MKKLLSLVIALMLASICFAQKDVTKFLGIPVDGTKSDMIQKLKAKGFTYNQQKDWLEGEFNGRNVYLLIGTNKNKVYRIVVADAIRSNETNIKGRYNRLLRQFKYNDKYTSYTDDKEIPEGEDISYEITVNNKRYEASFCQRSYKEGDSLALSEYVYNELKERYTKDEIDSMNEEEKKNAFSSILFDYHLLVLPKKSVWFTIGKEYDDYYIYIYYDNEYNMANGEDL